MLDDMILGAGLEMDLGPAALVFPDGVGITAFVTPEQFGAIGDGETDDTAAIRRALATKQTVVFRCGKTYKITDSLTIYSGQIVDLNGATIHMTADKPIFVKPSDLSAVSNVVIRGGFLSGTVSANENTTFTEQCGVKMPTFHSRFEDLRFDNLCYGVYLAERASGSATLVENKILNCKFANCMTAGVYGAENALIENGVMDNCKFAGTGFDHGILLHHSAGWQLSNIHVYGRFATGIELRNAGGTTLVNFDVDYDYTNAALIIHRFNSCMIANGKIAAQNAGTYCVWSQVSTSATWTVKPLLLANIEISSSAPAGTGIVPFHGVGYAQAVNVMIHDENGAFTDSDLDVRDYGDGKFVAAAGGSSAKNNTNLNNLTTPGTLRFDKSAAASSAINLPASVTGRLYIIDPNGGSGNYQYRRQFYLPYSTNYGLMFTRYGNTSNGGETWTWHDWEQFAPLPAFTAADEGKSLSIVNGALGWA